MEVRVSLSYDYGYSWFSAGGISVKGFIYDEKQQPVIGAALVAYFETVVTAEDFRVKLVEANGLFAVIIQKEGFTFFATDRTRTFPLFYARQQEMLLISDAAEQTVPGAMQLSELAKEEFLFTGYVTGAATLLSGVQQVQAGEYITVAESLNARFYHLYIAGTITEQSFEALAEQLAVLFEEVGKRMISALKGRTALVPLSGGYDSRLIAVLLKKHKYPKVICYTYGLASGQEVKLSERVAQQLGFPWHFIPYTPGTIGDFTATPAFKAYMPFAANYTSMFFTQDYFAVRYLVTHHLIPEDTVVIPGHTGDFIAGGHLVPDLREENVVAHVLNRHYVFSKKDKSSFAAGISFPKVPALPYEYFENWNFKERQAKFIINSNRIYEFWGMEHLIPLWDKALILFFQQLGLEHKTGRKLFDQVLFRYFFEPEGLAFTKPVYPFMLQKMRGVRNRLRRMLFADPLNFKLIARSFLKDKPLNLRWSSKKVNINSIQTTWYIAWLEEKIKTDNQ